MTTSEIDNINSLGVFINQYGFLTLFAVVILICIFIYFKRKDEEFKKTITLNNRKQESELKITENERNAQISQNQKMFDLVTNVQTEQVTQLQNMTDTLHSIKDEMIVNVERVTVNGHFIEKIGDNVNTLITKNEDIINTIGTILEYVERSDTYNKEILNKVKSLETYLYELDPSLQDSISNLTNEVMLNELKETAKNKPTGKGKKKKTNSSSIKETENITENKGA